VRDGDVPATRFGGEPPERWIRTGTDDLAIVVAVLPLESNGDTITSSARARATTARRRARLAVSSPSDRIRTIFRPLAARNASRLASVAS
jgi:hypothetical protein